jgi:hypothetical protein
MNDAIIFFDECEAIFAQVWKLHSLFSKSVFTSEELNFNLCSLLMLRLNFSLASAASCI